MLGSLEHVRTNKRQLNWLFPFKSQHFRSLVSARSISSSVHFHLPLKQWELYKYCFIILKQPTNAYVSHQFVARHKGV